MCNPGGNPFPTTRSDTVHISAFFQDPHAKGELIIGSHTEGYSLQEGIKSGKHQDEDYCFILVTPGRDFVLKAITENERRMWMDCLSKVIAQPMTDEDKQGWNLFSMQL